MYMQGDVDTRSKPEDLNQWFVRGSSDAMTSFSAFATTRWIYGPETLSRYNGQTSYEIQGQAASGSSSGTAMDQMEKLAAELPGTSMRGAGCLIRSV